MKAFTEIDKHRSKEYIDLLNIIAKLSKLFSENQTPYLQYRIAENLFCKCYNAENLSRKDTAFDAKIGKTGIGIKTFICEGNFKTEKIAEFNRLSSTINKLESKELARELAIQRNKRIELGRNLDGIENSLYHIIARKPKEWKIFETDYEKIQVENLHSIKRNDKSLQFKDGLNEYSYNFSKSTLFRKFEIPKNAISFPVEIVNDPYDLLLKVLDFKTHEIFDQPKKLIKGIDYIVLPLYSYKKNKITNVKDKFVFTDSGLNQWHSKPRKNQDQRNPGEVYIPVPSIIHKKYPHFFPPNTKNKTFSLSVPTGDIFKAKMCQTYRMEIDGEVINKGKGLMTNPNKDLSLWLLRKLLQLEEGELATIEKLESIGFDSVMIYKDKDANFKIDKAKLNSFEEFLEE
jgi:hypothetical protein